MWGLGTQKMLFCCSANILVDHMRGASFGGQCFPTACHAKTASFLFEPISQTCGTDRILDPSLSRAGRFVRTAPDTLKRVALSRIRLRLATGLV